MKRRVYLILIFGLVLLLLFVFLWKEKQDVFEVSFLNVGQGDAILLESVYGQNILIDGGPDNSVLYELGKNLPFFEKRIDLIILTHPHADHFMGLIEVIKRYQVDKILDSGALEESLAYEEFLDTAKEKNIEIVIVKKREKIVLGQDCYLDILWPEEDFENKVVKNPNNVSVVVKLVYGKNSFLFTGDIEAETEKELLKKGINLQADVLKVAHHGSDTSSSEDFLKAINPEIAVIPVGKGNKFGFPKAETLKKLKDMGVKIFDTFETKVFYSDGNLIGLQ